MSFLPIKLDQLQESELQALVSNKVPEGKTIEYKQELPGNSDGDKKEFLADVSSFANTATGHLIYGMSDKDGMPQKLDGVPAGNTNQQILRIEEMIRTGIEPRIHGIATTVVALASKQAAFVLYIPHSWQAPHRVSYKNDGKFYARNSRGKYQLDIGELRAAFALSETAVERIRNFRADRLSKIKAGDTPVVLPDAPKIVVHTCPLNITERLPTFDIPNLIQQTRNTDMLKPFYSSGWSHRPNMDGFTTYSMAHDGKTYNYLQVFRTGAIEAVSANLTDIDNRSGYLPSIAYEKEILAEVGRMLNAQTMLGVEPPIFIMVSLLGVKGYRMGVGNEFMRSLPDNPYIDRDDLILPEAQLDAYGGEIDRALQPAFDAVWNSAGWQRSWNYDDQGNWVGKG